MVWVGMQQDHDSNALLIATVIPSKPQQPSLARCFDFVRNPIYPNVAVPAMEMDKMLLDVEMSMMKFQQQYRWIQFRARFDQENGIPFQTVSENFNQSRGQLFASDTRFTAASFLGGKVMEAINNPILSGTINSTPFGQDMRVLRDYVRHNQPDFAIDAMGELFVAEGPYAPKLENVARYVGMEAAQRDIAAEQAYAFYSCQMRP